MATTPVKSQPLHNFPFSFLRWGTTTHAGAGAVDHRSSPDSDADPDPLHPVRVGSRSARVHRFSSSSKKRTQHRQEIAVEKVGEAALSKRGFGGLSSKLPGKAAVVEEEDKGAEAAMTTDAEEEEEEATHNKPWNLRPRKPETAVAIVLALEKQTESSAAAAAAQKSMRLRGSSEINGVAFERKEKKMKFWIALSKEEIEEDIFIMTGSRPARRPRKRPKNVQKQLDTVFPGLWLVGSTADAFRLPDAPVKI